MWVISFVLYSLIRLAAYVLKILSYLVSVHCFTGNDIFTPYPLSDKLSMSAHVFASLQRLVPHALSLSLSLVATWHCDRHWLGLLFLLLVEYPQPMFLLLNPKVGDKDKDFIGLRGQGQGCNKRQDRHRVKKICMWGCSTDTISAGRKRF